MASDTSARVQQEPVLDPRVTRRAIGLPSTWTDVVDVLLDDARVFSIAPDQGRTTPAGRRRVEWPAAVKPYLKGSTTVTLRAHLTGAVLARADVTFSDRAGRVRVVDEDGHPLALNKWGHLERPFEGDSPDKELMLDSASELASLLNDGVGVPAFIAYGTLLGAVRNGRLIGHDTDVDVAYYSSWQHPADLMRESFAIQRRLVELGWRVSRRSGACLQVRKVTEGVAGPRIDLFTAYHCNGWFAMEKAVRGRLPREAVLPLTEVALEGRRFPAPNDPAALLALTYGESWRVPDPAFTYRFPEEVRQRSDGWFGLRQDRVHWREASRSGHDARREPSPLAHHVDGVLDRGTTVVDVGCGVGTDAAWLARNGRRVIGLDYVPDALRSARRRAGKSSSARFEQLNLYDLRAVLAKGAEIALDEPDVVLHANRLLNALRGHGRANLWIFAKVVLGGGGALFLEFETLLAADGSRQPVVPPLLHGLDPEEVVAEVEARGGRVLSRDESDHEGRRVCRLAVAFSATPAS